MGSRGPQPQPTELRVLRGTHRRDRHGDSASLLRPPAEAPACPEWLGEHGKTKWAELSANLHGLGLLTAIDADVLAAYCQAFDDLHAALAMIATKGYTAMSEKGGVYQHPAVGIKNKAIERIRQFGREFGMTPAARTGMNIEQSKKSGGVSRRSRA